MAGKVGIAGVIRALTAEEDMFGTALIVKLDERICAMNDGQLRLTIQHIEQIIPTLTNKMCIDSNRNLLAKASAEWARRREIELETKRQRMAKLRQTHAGANAKAWEKKHASLDKELVAFRHFLRQKTHDAAEKEVRDAEATRLFKESLLLPERRLRGYRRRTQLWVVGCFSLLSSIWLALLPVPAAAAGVLASFAIVAGMLCMCFGHIRATVRVWPLGEEEMKRRIKARQAELLAELEIDVRRHYEEFETKFASEDKAHRESRRRAAEEATVQPLEASKVALVPMPTFAASRVAGESRSTGAPPGVALAPPSEPPCPEEAGAGKESMERHEQGPHTIMRPRSSVGIPIDAVKEGTNLPAQRRPEPVDPEQAV